MQRIRPPHPSAMERKHGALVPAIRQIVDTTCDQVRERCLPSRSSHGRAEIREYRAPRDQLVVIADAGEEEAAIAKARPDRGKGRQQLLVGRHFGSQRSSGSRDRRSSRPHPPGPLALPLASPRGLPCRVVLPLDVQGRPEQEEHESRHRQCEQERDEYRRPSQSRPTSHQVTAPEDGRACPRSPPSGEGTGARPASDLRAVGEERVESLEIGPGVERPQDLLRRTKERFGVIRSTLAPEPFAVLERGDREREPRAGLP
jgi:hypothetical protein